MAKQLTRSAVRIYGALSALGKNSGNVLEGLLPFFEPILREHNGNKLDPDVIAAAIRDTYKWNFNSDLVETFVPYLVRHGWLVADIPGSRDTTYTIQIAHEAIPDASTQTVEAELHRIATQFQEFSEALSPLTTIPRETEEFEDILVEWLLYVEAFSEKSIEFKERVRTDASGKLRHELEIPNTTSLKDEEKFLCARFVKHAIEEDQGTAEILARIAAIGLLTEVVQDFVKPVTSVDKTDLIVYLDAPVAMELLGVSGKLACENTSPIVAELIRIGASVRIFGQSVEEIKHSLHAVLMNSRPTGPTAQALSRNEVLREYVTEVSRNPVPILEAMGVKAAYRTREQMPSDHQFFTMKNWQGLYSMIRYTDNPSAREHDTDITAFVVRQRRGRTSQDIFKSHVVALTRNGLFAQIVRRACFEMSGLSDETVPPVIHRRVLATAMWLRTGMGAGDLNVPKRMLLASCEHVLAIRPGVVEAVKRLTDALGDEDKSRQLDLLISQDRSTQALMDKTLGVSNVVTKENFSLLWQEMLHPHLEEERQKRREAVNKERAEGEKQLGKANKKIEEIQKRRDQETASLGAKLEAKQREDHSVIGALCSDVESALRRARTIRIGIGVVLGLTFSIPLLMETTPFVRWASLLIGWFLAYLTITGGKLIRIGIDEKRALNALHSTAKRRSLGSKLDQFDVSWDKTAFVVADRPEPPSCDCNDLFNLSSADK